MSIYIDGTNVWNTNYNDPDNTLWQVQKTWEVPTGQHVIEVRGTGGGSLYMDVDAFITDVYGNTGNHQDSNLSAIGYLGNWTHSTCCPLASNGDISWSNTENDAAVFTFYGTGVRYIHTKAYNRGKVKVTIDGTYVETIDLYANPNQWERTRSYSGLGLGWHHIHFAVEGSKNPLSTDYYVDIDKLEVIP